ncbi:unnamed protein product [Urochloa decumbens]|uniref:F-box domain-containing protein n=1 Tax=Urochloa decumbens TaxID=240449 RepID=A0ABC9F2E0_9POAL
MEPPPASRERAAAVDRLRDLPDGVLLDVLSRLTFRQAVRTGALSRRWRSLWHAVPYPTSSIDIDHRAFQGKDNGVIDSHLPIRRGEDDEAQERRFAFLDFGDRVTTTGAAAGDPPLGAFRLRVADRDGFNAAHRWIRRALTRRPMAVALRCDAWSSWPCVTEGPEFSFHQYCRGGGAFTGRLRALQLCRVKLEKEFAGAIANDLPVLEDLRLQECVYMLTRIASASLQNLDIHHCYHYGYGVGGALALAAPRLATLRIYGETPPVAVEGEMPSLVAASLEHRAGILLGSVSHATDLSLSYVFDTSALLGDGEEPKGFPVFRNLRNLVLDRCDIGVECQALRHFLRNSPNLETLALRYCDFFGGSRSNKRKARSSSDKAAPSGGRRVPATCACNNLKWVEFQCFDYLDDQDVSEVDVALEEIEIAEGIFELYDALEEIPKKVVHPIESSIHQGRRIVRISYE